MALIGPRPLLVQYLPLYNEEQARRHEVRPGITGWAQVNGRNAISWKKKFELDIWYVDHVCFMTDMMIFYKTLKCVISRKGISKRERQPRNHLTETIREELNLMGLFIRKECVRDFGIRLALKRSYSYP